jgi:hypothetical protein
MTRQMKTSNLKGIIKGTWAAGRSPDSLVGTCGRSSGERLCRCGSLVSVNHQPDVITKTYNDVCSEAGSDAYGQRESPQIRITIARQLQLH